VGIFGQIDHAHPTFAQYFENPIMGDCLADHVWTSFEARDGKKTGAVTLKYF
jgi:hypothetical protein